MGSDSNYASRWRRLDAVRNWSLTPFRNLPMAPLDIYDSTYRHHTSDPLAEVRREAYDEDIGQNSWLTVAELRRLIEWLDISAEDRVLEVACGSGGPACYVAQITGCHLTGIDYSADGVATARSLAQEKGLADRTRFLEADANTHLPFEDAEFDALLCIDALNHLRDRRFVLQEWTRVLRPGGAMVFTDPVVVTGAVTHEEFAIRSSIGFFLFVPQGYTDKVLEDVALQIVHVEDASDAAASTSVRRRAARARLRDAIIPIEGESAFEAYQTFLQVVHNLSASRRLSRFIYHAIKPTR